MSQLTAPHTNGTHQEDEGDGLLDELIASAPEAKMDGRESALIGMQIATASKRKRSLREFIDLATEYATVDEETAASCTYAIPRDGKTIVGPSIRLAEICAMAWGSIHSEARVVDIGKDFITLAASAWDMVANVRMGQEVRRRITTKAGKRYGDDMIITTANAGMSIAMRNAILRVIPRAFVEKIRLRCAAVVKGDEKTLGARRVAMMQHFGKLGAKEPWILAAIGRKGVEDITLDDMVVLKGFATSIKEGTAKLEEIFRDPSKPAASEPSALEEKIKSASNGTKPPEATPPNQEPPEPPKVEQETPQPGELPPDTPMDDSPMGDAEKAAIAAEEAAQHAPGSPKIDPDTLSKAELEAAIRVEMKRTKTSEKLACQPVTKMKLDYCSEGELRIVLRALSRMIS